MLSSFNKMFWPARALLKQSINAGLTQLMWWLRSARWKGWPMPWLVQSCRQPVPDDDEPCAPAKWQRRVLEDDTEMALREAMEPIQIKNSEERHLICFLCLGNANLLLKERILKHTTPSSLTDIFYENISILPGRPEGLSVMFVTWSCLNGKPSFWIMQSAITEQLCQVAPKEG